MRKRVPQPSKFHLFLAFTLSAVLAFSFLPTACAQNLSPSTFISFDAPGAGTGSGQGTYPTAIARHGWIGGTLIDGANVPHGFLRSRNGSFISADPPHSLQAYVSSVNVRGQVVGSFLDTGRNTHGFLRDYNGKYTQLDAIGHDCWVEVYGNPKLLEWMLAQHK